MYTGTSGAAILHSVCASPPHFIAGVRTFNTVLRVVREGMCLVPTTEGVRFTTSISWGQ